MQPAKSFRDGSMSVSYWEPEGEEKRPLRVTFQKRYKGADGSWKNTGVLFLDEIPKAISLLQNAYDFLQARQASASGEEA